MSTIEVADPSEIHLCRPLIDEFVRAHGALTFRPGYRDLFLRWLAEKTAGEDAVVLVAREAPDIIGLAVGTVEENPPHLIPARIGYVPILVVASGRRRKGTGRQLWEGLRGWFVARGVMEVQLYTAVANAPAAAFWQGLGGAVFLERRRIRLGNTGPKR